MVKVEGTEFKGISYITNNATGTWVWEVKPVLDPLTQQWKLPETHIGKPGFTMLLNQVNGSVLPTLLNQSEQEFNNVYKVFDKPRIFKITLSEVTDED